MSNFNQQQQTYICDLNNTKRNSRLDISMHPNEQQQNDNNNQPVAAQHLMLDNFQHDPDLVQLNSSSQQMQFSKLPQQPQLSKLTLSTSLHQLNDSKYLNQSNAHNNNNNQQCETNNNVQSRTKTTNEMEHKQREANLDTVHVVVGNEACDLDSAVSCLLMFHIISKMSDEINGKDKTRTLYIPLLNTTRDMLESKSEVLWFLQKTLNIDKSFLTCKDDIDWAEMKKNGVEVLITLVDHNYNDEFKDIGRVVEIIDHHQVQDPKWLMENLSSIRLTLDTSVGSCTTLVAERLFYIYAEHHVSDDILLLIYGTVLLDTICLSEKAKRFTRRDIYLLKKLDSLLGNRKPVRDQLYKQLVEVKNSPRGLSFERLMKRDLKVYKDKHGMRIGIASLFGMAAQEALGLAVNIDLDQFFQLNNYEAFVIMGLIANLENSDSISRDLVLISSNGALFEELCKAFEADTSKLDLLPIGSDSNPDPEDNIINNKRIVDFSGSSSAPANLNENSNPIYKARIWLQRNVSSSRKVVAPLVLKVLHDGA